MSDIMEKTLNSVANFFTGNFGPRNSDISLGFDNLIRTVTRSSKAEVDKVIEKEIELLQRKLSQPDNSVNKIKEYLVRILYCEMLGHNTAVCHIHAIKLSQQKSLQEKRIGYLAICIFMHEDHELLVLMVNTFQRDLQSSNFLEVCMALTAVSYLGTGDMIPALLPLIQKHMSHPKDVVRKKAVMTMFAFYRKSPMLMHQKHDLFKKALCDSKPTVMSAALHVFKYFIKEDCERFKDIVPSLVQILHQIVHNKLQQDFDYHSVPAPWIQITILKMLSMLGQGDVQTSLLMHDVLSDALRQSKQNNSIAYALQFECIITITRIESTKEMLAACSQCIDKFLKSTNHNLKYLGITALSCISQVEPQLASEHQVVVIDCLKDPDNTIQIKTLELLYRMSNTSNVEVICNRYLTYLQTNDDLYIKKDLLQKILEMATKYGLRGTWYINTVNQVLLMAGVVMGSDARNQIIAQIKDLSRWTDADSLAVQAVDIYMDLLSRPVLSHTLLQVAIWVVGEFWQPEIGAPANEVLNVFSDLLKSCSDTSSHSTWLVTSTGKILGKSNINKTLDALELMKDGCSMETRQRIFELNELCEDPDLMDNMYQSQTHLEDDQVDSTLSFLDEYVSDALEAGAAPYRPRQQRHTDPNTTLQGSTLLGGLKFQPYDSPTTSAASTGGSVLTPSKSDDLEETQQSSDPGSNRESSDNLQLKGVQQVWSKGGYVKKKGGSKAKLADSSKVDHEASVPSVMPPMSMSKDKAQAMLSLASATPVASITSLQRREKQLLADEIFGGVTISLNAIKKTESVKRDTGLPSTCDPNVDLLSSNRDITMATTDNSILDAHIVVVKDFAQGEINSSVELNHALQSHDLPHDLSGDITEASGDIHEIGHEMFSEDHLMSSLVNVALDQSDPFQSTLSSTSPVNVDSASLLDVQEEARSTIPDFLTDFPSSSTHEELCVSDLICLRMCRVWKPNDLVLVFFLLNKSRIFTLTNFNITLNCPSNLQCSIQDQDTNTWSSDSLPPSSMKSVPVHFNYKSPSFYMNLGGQLSFVDNNKTLQRMFFTTDIMLTDLIRPMLLNTEEFGKKWKSPMFENKLRIERGALKKMEQVMQIISNKLGFHQVEIIGEEAIASGSILASIPCLLHAKFDDKSLQLWIRTTSKLLADCLAQEAKKCFNQ